MLTLCPLGGPQAGDLESSRPCQLPFLMCLSAISVVWPLWVVSCLAVLPAIPEGKAGGLSCESHVDSGPWTHPSCFFPFFSAAVSILYSMSCPGSEAPVLCLLGDPCIPREAEALVSQTHGCHLLTSAKLFLQPWWPHKGHLPSSTGHFQDSYSCRVLMLPVSIHPDPEGSPSIWWHQRRPC